MSAQEEKPVTTVEDTPQSRAEKKARKAILGSGLKAVAGINRVTFTRGQGVRIINRDLVQVANW